MLTASVQSVDSIGFVVLSSFYSSPLFPSTLWCVIFFQPLCCLIFFQAMGYLHNDEERCLKKITWSGTNSDKPMCRLYTGTLEDKREAQALAAAPT